MDDEVTNFVRYLRSRSTAVSKQTCFILLTIHVIFKFPHHLYHCFQFRASEILV